MNTTPYSVPRKTFASLGKGVCLLATAFALCLTAQAAKVALKVEADATIDQELPGTNFGSSAHVVARDSSDEGPRPVQKGYLRFDASNLPQVKDIESFDVFFTAKRGRTGVYYLITGAGANDWVESTINWNNAPANKPDVNLDGFVAAEGLVVVELGRNVGQPNALGQVELGTKSVPAQKAKEALINALNTGERKATIAFHHTGSRTYGISSKEGKHEAATLNLIVAD